MHHLSYSVAMVLGILKDIALDYGWPTMRSVANTIIEITTSDSADFYRVWNRNCTERHNLISLYVDYLDMVVQMGCTLPVNIPVGSVRSSHNIATELFNLHKYEIEQAKWDKHKPTWKKWTFSDGDYIAVAPEKPADLANEGITLHHCVKSYIGRVSDGITNIMFIRKKDEPDVPFFTVEISNESAIEQIHGDFNRNLDSEPALVPFVKKWVKACKLTEHGYDKVR